MEDRKLVELAREGCTEAFGELVSRYQAKVFQMAVSFVRDRETADDLSQEVFLKAYLALPRFKFQSEFGTWLYRISLNHIRDFLRKKKRFQAVSLETLGEIPVQDDSNEAREREAEERKRGAFLREALEKLPPKFRTVLTLRDIQGLSYEEIVKILRVSPGTLDSRLHRARKSLRKMLAPVLSGEGGLNEMP